MAIYLAKRYVWKAHLRVMDIINFRYSVVTQLLLARIVPRYIE